MKVAVQQEDLQLLAITLQEQVLAKVPSGEVFQIKCAVKKDQLMILTQHPEEVTVDGQNIFVVLKQALQSLPTYRDQQVQCFIRILGQELPYARCSYIIQPQEEITSSSLIHIPSTIENEPEEIFDCFPDPPDLWTTPPQRPVKSLLLGIILLGICVFGSGFYFLTRPCVMLECQEMQTALSINWKYRQLIGSIKEENQLVAIQQQLKTVSTNLGNIPRWSPRYRQAEELKTSLSMHSDKINQVITALQVANVAEKKMQTPVNSTEELTSIQHSWRQAIAPLEAIPPTDELYGLVKPRLSKFRVSLQTVNQQLLTEEKWLKKLNDAEAVAIVAQERAATAKSVNDWQKARSTWQVVINGLNMIPPNSPAYPEAQKLLLNYQLQLARTRDRATTEEIAARSYQQAMNTADQAKTYEQNNQWQIAVTYWEQALQSAKQVAKNTFYYNQSQNLVVTYSTALEQAQEQLQSIINWQKVGQDLDKTCVREIRVCTFTINNSGIAVSLTPDYERVLETTLSESDLQTTNHWYILQEALSAIGDNARMPVFIYDTQGKGIYTHIPQG
jgi:tetratricopeptide (TPR) repeat protein